MTACEASVRSTLKLALEALEAPWNTPYVDGCDLVLGKKLKAITAIKEALREHAMYEVQRLGQEIQPEQEPFGYVTVRRLSQRLENHHDQYQFYPAGQSPYLDNVDECHVVYSIPSQTDLDAICQDLQEKTYNQAMRIAELEAKLAQQEPVAWGMPSAEGGFIVDCITPEEHDRVEGGYTVPLYTTPPTQCKHCLQRSKDEL